MGINLTNILIKHKARFHLNIWQKISSKLIFFGYEISMSRVYWRIL